MQRIWMLNAWRNFVKHKSFSLVTVSGLALGLACSIVILLYILDELKYDRFHTHANRIFQINAITHYDGSETRYPTTSTPLAEAITADIPEAEAVGRLFGRQVNIQLTGGESDTFTDKKYLEDNFFFADPGILDAFTFHFLWGNPETALRNPNQIILSKTIAAKYFGSPDKALGKQLLLEGSIPMEVSGVIEDFPRHSTNNVELLAHFENYFTIETEAVRDYLRRDWLYNPVSTYILLKAGASQEEVTRKIQALNNRYADERVKEHVRYELQPLTSVHLYSDYTYAAQRNTIRYVYIFATIGSLILLIACINFINLSTVHALRRAKEIGIRKVVGAMRRNLILQFLFESWAHVFVSFLLAITMIYFALPVINEVAGKRFDAHSLISGEIVLSFLAILIVTGILAGYYPAKYISGFNPVAALKGLKDSVSNGSYLVRRVLVVIQFTASIILIVYTNVIYQQIRFMGNEPLGFQKDHVLTIPLFSSNPNSVLGGGVDRELRTRMNSFENELLVSPAIEAVTVSSVLPGQGAVNALVTTDSLRDTDNVFVPIVSVDYDFINTYGIKMMAGRDFSREAGADHLQSFIANEEAVKRLGWHTPGNAIGKSVQALGKQAFIVGVIKDYHFEGLQQPLRPLLLEVDVSRFAMLSLRLKEEDLAATVDHVKEVWNTIFPEKAFEYGFLDDQLEQNYAQEQQFGTLVNLFSGVAIFISALGLFGLASYLSHQKQKEAGIRKILGATTVQVFYTLSKEFIKIILISLVISIPLGYYFSASWLDNFAFRIAVGGLPFAISFGCIILMVFLTTTYQTFRTASVNPVKTIRNE